jgi:superfamily I DNA and/or RNA helicase
VSNEGFVLIQGPPGTGKTKTIEGILSVLLMNKIRDDDTNTNVDEIKSPHVSEKILVVAPSNAAVDELAARLTTKGLILLNDRDMDLVKNNKFSLETKSTFRFTYDESIQCYRYVFDEIAFYSNDRCSGTFLIRFESALRKRICPNICNESASRT